MDSSCLDEDAVRRLIDLNQKLQVEVHQKMLVLHKQIEENDMYKRKMTDVWKHMHHKGILAQGLEVCWHKEKKTLVVPLEDKCVEVPATRYFVSKQGTVPKPNQDTVRLSDVYEYMPIPLKIPEWKEKERECLRNALLEEVVRQKLANMYRSKQQKNKNKNNKAEAEEEEEAAEEGEDTGLNGNGKNYSNDHQDHDDDDEGEDEDDDDNDDGDTKGDVGLDLAAAYTALQTCRRDMDLSQGEDRKLLDKVDWEKVTEKLGMAGYPERDLDECKFQWYCHEDPKLALGRQKVDGDENNAANASQAGTGPSCSYSGSLTVEEGNRLLDIAQKYSMKDWDRILEELGPADENIKPMTCLQYFQRNRTNRSIVHKWSEEEDKLLKAAVDQYQRENKTHWNKWVIVANSVPNKSARQCLQRWRNYNMKINNEQATGNPKYTREWSNEEDLLLKELVEEHGSSWKKVSQGIPNKTDRQCRQRYIHINPNLKQTEWTEEEKFKLNEVVIDNYQKNLGKIKWADVGRAMQRCRNLCRKRWHRISAAYFGSTVREFVKECVTEVLAEVEAEGPPLTHTEEDHMNLPTTSRGAGTASGAQAIGTGTGRGRGKKGKAKQQAKKKAEKEKEVVAGEKEKEKRVVGLERVPKRSYWTKEEELELLRVLQEHFAASDPKLDKIMWTSIKGDLPRSVMKCKRKLGFIQQHLSEDVVASCVDSLARDVVQEVSKEEQEQGAQWYTSDLLQEQEAEGSKRQKI